MLILILSHLDLTFLFSLLNQLFTFISFLPNGLPEHLSLLLVLLLTLLGLSGFTLVLFMGFLSCDQELLDLALKPLSLDLIGLDLFLRGVQPVGN
jgi:hypothetical protein